MKKKILIVSIVLIIIALLLIIILPFKSDKIASGTNVNIYNQESSSSKFSEYTTEIEKISYELEKAKVPVLMYHSITDDMKYIEYSINAVSPNDFEQQLKKINELQMQTLFFEDLEEIHKYSKPIILTFDDGFEDFYYNAFPLIKKYNVKATLFMIVGYINCSNYCTLEQLREMVNSGLVKIESHTMSHPKLTLLDGEDLKDQINRSSSLLEEYLGNEISSICYPYGLYNKNVDTLVKQKYKYAITMNEGLYDLNVHTKYEIPRYTIPRGMTITRFCDIINNSIVKLKY